MSAETTSPPLHAPLDEYVHQYRDLERDARRLTDGLSDAQLNWKPDAKRWSIGQCLAHLNAVGGPYADALEKAIDEARERGLATGAPVRYSWLERWAIRTMEPPPGWRMPAPAMFKPQTPEHTLAEVMGEYAALKRHYLELLARADGLDVGRFKIASPESKLIRLRVGAAFAFLASHERRHLWQARQVREDAAFPAE